MIYDYVIVGGGLAGSYIFNELVNKKNLNILMIDKCGEKIKTRKRKIIKNDIVDKNKINNVDGYGGGLNLWAGRTKLYNINDLYTLGIKEVDIKKAYKSFGVTGDIFPKEQMLKSIDFKIVKFINIKKLYPNDLKIKIYNNCMIDEVNKIEKKENWWLVTTENNNNIKTENVILSCGGAQTAIILAESNIINAEEFKIGCHPKVNIGHLKLNKKLITLFGSIKNKFSTTDVGFETEEIGIGGKTYCQLITNVGPILIEKMFQKFTSIQPLSNAIINKNIFSKILVIISRYIYRLEFARNGRRGVRVFLGSGEDFECKLIKIKNEWCFQYKINKDQIKYLNKVIDVYKEKFQTSHGIEILNVYNTSRIIKTIDVFHSHEVGLIWDRKKEMLKMEKKGLYIASPAILPVKEYANPTINILSLAASKIRKILS